MRTTCTLFLLFILSSSVLAQISRMDSLLNAESLKNEILTLRADVDNIQVNLGKSERRFKRGIVVATLGYSVTIAGGLMLGRKRDELGKGLLVAGGITGVTGTILMVDAFKFLGRASHRKGR
jgi:hypothetical protein